MGGLNKTEYYVKYQKPPFTIDSIMVVLLPVFRAMGCSHSRHIKIEKSGKNKPGFIQKPNCCSFMRTHNHSLRVILHQDSLRDSVREENFTTSLGWAHFPSALFEGGHLWCYHLKLGPTGKKTGTRLEKTRSFISVPPSPKTTPMSKSGPEFRWAWMPDQTKWAI